MENTTSQQLIADRFKEIPQELREYLLSEELVRKIELVAKKYRLNPDQEAIFQNEITLVLLVLDSVDSLEANLMEGLGLSSENAKELAKDSEEYILEKVISYLVYEKSDLVIKDEVPEQIPPQSNTLMRQSAVSSIPVRPEESLLKAHLISQIENPPRTVIKKYVLEHEPITDPEHLIDDTVDERPKLGA